MSSYFYTKLDELTLAIKLNEGAKKIHTIGEHVDFAKSVLKCVVQLTAYRKLVANLYFVYSALEEEVEQHKQHPILSRVYFKELNRKHNLEKDLKYYYGAQWQEEINLSPTGEVYVRRIREVSNFQPILLISHAPPVQVILAQTIQFFSQDQETEADLPESVDERIALLLSYLRSSRCLLILDNAESILSRSSQAGQYREGYEGYGELLRRVGELSHRSCLLLTSREKPKDLVPLEGKKLLVRSLELKGLKAVDGEKIFKVKGLTGSEEELKALIDCYGGNALALKIVSTTIQDVFDGSISVFLKYSTIIFGDFRELLNQQFERLTKLEIELCIGSVLIVSQYRF